MVILLTIRQQPEPAPRPGPTTFAAGNCVYSIHTDDNPYAAGGIAISKSLLYRLFKLGRIPAAQRAVLEREGIILAEEGLSGVVIFKNFRAPGRRYSYRRAGFSGSLVITRLRFSGFSFSRPIVNLPLQREHLDKIQVSAEDGRLVVAFDPAPFHEGWSGWITVKFSTPNADAFLSHLKAVP